MSDNNINNTITNTNTSTTSTVLMEETPLDLAVRLWANQHNIPISCNRYIDSYNNSSSDNGGCISIATDATSSSSSSPLSSSLSLPRQYYFPTSFSSLRSLFDSSIFPKYNSIVALGKRNFNNPSTAINSARSIDQLLSDAIYFTPQFKQFINSVIASVGEEKCYYYAGNRDRYLYKSIDRSNSKVEGWGVDKIRDVLRASIICNDIATLELSIKKAVELCDNSNFDYKFFNFYENRIRYGDEDREKGLYTGYYGCHLTIVMREEREKKRKGREGEGEKDGGGEGVVEEEVDVEVEPPRVLLAEIQFHVSSIFHPFNNNSSSSSNNSSTNTNSDSSCNIDKEVEEEVEEEDICIKTHTHPIYQSIYKGDEHLGEEDKRKRRELLRSIVELYYSYGLYMCN